MARPGRPAALLLCTALLLLSWASPAVGQVPPGGTFVDDDGNLHEGFIEAIAARGITVGCARQPPRYCPEEAVDRAAMAAFLLRAIGHAEEDHLPAFRGLFADVAPGAWYARHVEHLYDHGITRGCALEALRYCPLQPVTRAEMAAFLLRAIGHAEEDHLPAFRGLFADVAPGAWYARHVEHLHDHRITRGCALEPLRYCPADPVLRDQTASFLGRMLWLEPMVPPPRPAVALRRVVGGLSEPLFLTAPPGDDRLFIVEKGGAIRISSGGSLRTEPFLDLSGLVSGGPEQGLLGLAFHPGYSRNGRFFVHYTDRQGDTRLVEYRASADPNRADPHSAREVLRVDQPFSNHNGGMVAFGPDGYLYLALGDGGSGGDPRETGEDPHDLLGSILRLDVDAGAPYGIPPDNPFVSGGGAPEVWAYGLRNPWRFSFDPPSFDFPAGLIYVADVGQSAWEEVDVARADAAGLDYGWDRLEGSHCFEACSAPGSVLPVLEYPIPEEGCAVVGGYVYRGRALPQLEGHYFYADFCGGWIRSFFYDGGVTLDRDWSDRFGLLGPIRSFGTDRQGELYVLAGDSAHRFVPEP